MSDFVAAQTKLKPTVNASKIACPKAEKSVFYNSQTNSTNALFRTMEPNNKPLKNHPINSIYSNKMNVFSKSKTKNPLTNQRVTAIVL